MERGKKPGVGTIVEGRGWGVVSEGQPQKNRVTGGEWARVGQKMPLQHHNVRRKENDNDTSYGARYGFWLSVCS